ncbi:hypothetical protein BD310DRAFT_524049 [Dichomitus squalens]|uniref:Uncharacterized protein n=1 Tax=Dichomitus squalens TaxID=114155 RepID=A0A4Q9Q895_9APHY|nr:hypothetical protein BD310DRAFT_524049 [Dichomitus squalens]
MLDCLDIQALDTSSLASPGTITQIAPCQDLDGLDFSGYYPTPLDSDALDAFLTSLLNSNVSPSLPASIPTSLFSPSDVQRPSSRLSLSSSLTSSRGSSPTSSPLDTPPSSPSIAAISLDTSFSGRPSVLSFPEDDLLASCGVNACDHSSSLLSLGIDLDFGWQTLLDLDPSTWAASPSSHISKPSPKPKESVGGLDVASSSAIAFIQDDGRNGS